MLKNWTLATRPKTLTAALSPVLFGAALASQQGPLHWPSLLLITLSAIGIQIGTNFANDYFDFKQGADTEDRLGPTRVTQAGLISEKTMKRATILMFGLSFLLGLFLVARGGWPILVIGSLSILFGVLYTGSRYSLAYLGIADIFVLIFFGPVAVGGTYFLQTLSLSPEVLILGLAPGLLSMAILAVNNLRDRPQDKLVNKKTIAVRFGATVARLEYTVCVLAGIGLPVFYPLSQPLIWTRFIPLLSLALAIPLIKSTWTQDGKPLNLTLARTGGLLLLFTLLYCIGLIT